MNNYLFTLYIAGQTSRSQRAVSNLRQACENTGAAYELVIVDILERPEAAEQAKILAIPTLVKESPLPIRKVIGDLSNHEVLINELDIKPA
ncbi:MAG: circadian clock KaiB family protein [Desulfovibrionaceae bacterium]|nr:circadian clock KaiB family protein [Desulfovibrionaceae bacterium]MBF0513738.1 circadian clock KaiB family protein [Desulfovibrionaceae bacterium]